jgi:hypothetical protein
MDVMSIQPLIHPLHLWYCSLSYKTKLVKKVAQSSLIQMVQPTTMATLRRHSTLCCSRGLMNASTNASVEMTLSPSLAFSTFPEPRTSLPDPIPSINLLSTLLTNTFIALFRRSSSRVMSLSTTVRASPVLCYRSLTSDPILYSES